MAGNAEALQRDAERKREQRQKNREVVIPPCSDLQLRLDLEADDVAWLRYFFPDLFWYDFTIQQREMIAAISHAILYGGDQALAASRGEGKTKLFERVLLKYTLQGIVPFAVLFAATGSAAQDSLDSIKSEIETNERLCELYPEVCVPVRALENTPNRAHYQIVSGKRHDTGREYEREASRFSWCGHEVVFPKVPGSPSSGAIFATRGLDAAVRGLNKGNRRPTVAGIDDPDTEETARSEEQAKKLEDRIDKAIGGLGGQQKGIARVMLTTLQNRICASFRFTDPKQKPTWKGRRFRFLITPPTRMNLWEEYMQLRIEDLQEGDEFARRSHQFYLDRFEDMNEGAEVANHNRFNSDILPDGSQVEVSALQRYYNEVSRIGPEAVATEYDNDPPEEMGPVESGITAHRIQRQVSGYDRKVIPPGCIKLTCGVDVRKVALHWVIRAWRADGTGFTINYGIYEIHGTTVGSDEGVDEAIYKAIIAFIDELRHSEDYQCATVDGEVMPIDRVLIDAGWRTPAVYAATAECGLGVSPVMGFGKSSGCVQTNFYDVQNSTKDKKPGDGWFLSRKGSVWLVCADADRWKAWEHDRWMTSPERPGAMLIYGQDGDSRTGLMSKDQKDHHSYAKHVTNEVEVEEPYRGTMRRRFKAKSENTHWFDASYYSDVAANMEGIRLLPSTAKSAQRQGPALTLAEMAAQARQA